MKPGEFPAEAPIFLVQVKSNLKQVRIAQGVGTQRGLNHFQTGNFQACCFRSILLCFQHS